MRRLLFCLLALGICLPAAMADETATMDFLVTKDAGVSYGYGGEWYNNSGATNTFRMAKNGNNVSIYDWQFDGAGGILEFITNNMTTPGYYPVFTLSIMTAADAASRTVDIYTINSDTDWIEGDGAGYPDFNWTKGLGAATGEYAETYYTDTDGIPGNGDEVLDTTNSVRWGDGTNTLRNAATVASRSSSPP